MHFKSIYFDLDGVLVDSMEYHSRAWQEVFTEHGVKVTHQMILENEGALEENILYGWFSSQGKTLESAQLPMLFEKQMSIFKESYLGKVKVFSEVPGILSNLREEGISLALVTSSPKNLVEHMLPANILSFFKVVISREMVSRHKPHPDPYLAAQKHIGQNDGSGLAIENAPPGIRSALGAGLTCYAVTTTLSKNVLQEAHQVFHGLRELFEFLKKSTN